MPTLEWIGKSKVINHHQEVPFRVLDRKYSFDENGQHSEDNGSENMIIRGDNLEALKALLPRYEGRVKCIYIDPPYNTGNENWVYNDNVNDPKIKKWLGEVVGKEGEDLTRHDKWLCMMYPRLRLLQKLLASDGCLIVSISYHELNNLVLILRELFGTKQVVVVTVQTSGGKPSGGFNYVQEYLVFVVPNDFQANALDFCGGNSRTPFEGLTLSTFDKTQRPNQTYPIFVDRNGVFAGVGKSLQEQIDDGTYNGEKSDFPYDYSIAPEGTVAIWPVTSKGKECVWRQIPDRLQSDWEKGYIKITPNKNDIISNQYSIQYLPSGVIAKIESGELEVLGHEDGVPTLKFGDNQTVGGQVPTIWTEKAFFTVNGTQTLKDIFPETPKKFEYPKPVSLIKSVIQAVTEDGDVILDSFAGSGTTAHAVLELNQETDANRSFILVEMESYAETTTAERVKRVISGYKADKTEVLYDVEITAKNIAKGADFLKEAKNIAADAKGKYTSVKAPKMEDGHLRVVAVTKANDLIAGINGNFSFYDLGEKLLIGECLNEAVSADKIREYIWFMETKAPYTPADGGNTYYLGKHNDAGYYFYYEPQSVTVLDYAFLATITEKASSTIIYADRCSISEEKLSQMGIVFKKIPRDISRL